jgi:hypothetical protein
MAKTIKIICTERKPGVNVQAPSQIETIPVNGFVIIKYPITNKRPTIHLNMWVAKIGCGLCVVHHTP